MSEATENHTITNIGAGIAKAVMNSNPITGFVQTIYDEYASRQWQQRREKWEEVFEEKLKDIQNDVDFIKINSIPNFAQILANATQGAMSDIEEDKVGLYANTVINSIKNEDIDNTKIHIFLNILRKYTLAHIETLMYFNNPVKYFSFIKKHNIHGAILYHISGERFSKESKNVTYEQREIEHIIIKELTEELLIYPTNHIDKVILNWGRLSAPITTQLGQEFLQFIAEQENSNG